MSTEALIHRLRFVDSCVEAIDWVQETRAPDMHTAWNNLDSGQWLCWVSVRVLGLPAVKALTSAVRGVAPLLTPAALATLDHAQAYADGKKNDEEALLIEAFDATGTGLHVAGAPGAALLAVSYAAHCAVKLKQAAKVAASPEGNRLSLRASAHAADAVLHALIASPGLAPKLPALVRSHIDERALSKAWHALPATPPAAASAGARPSTQR